MKCPETGTIQAYIDGELDIGARKDLENHLSHCGKCGDALESLKEADDFVFGRLSEYREHLDRKNDVPAKLSNPFRQLEKQPAVVSESSSGLKMDSKKGVWNFMHKYRRLTAAACIIMIAAVCFTVQPVRAAISDALKIFRVDRLEGLNISPKEIAQIKDSLSKGEGDFTLDNIGRIQMAGGKTTAVTYDEMVNSFGFPVLMPDNAKDPNPGFTVTEPSSLALTLDTDKANLVLKSFKATQLLPDEINGKTFTASFGARASANFIIDGNSFTLYETTPPNFEIPQGVDESALINAVTSIPIFPEELKKRLQSLNDWKNTLYVPLIDSSDVQTAEISLNGTTAYVSTAKTGNNGDQTIHSLVVWMKNDIIYGVSADTDKDTLVEFAKSLK